MDSADRAARSSRAQAMVFGLAEQGVVAVATTFVDNAGIARVKAVPLSRLPQLAGWGVGFSPAFDYFRFDDWVAAPASGEGPVGDQRIVPDLDRVVVLAGAAGLGLVAGGALVAGRRGAPELQPAAAAAAGRGAPQPRARGPVRLRDRVGHLAAATATTSRRSPRAPATAWPGWWRSRTTAAT